MFSGDKKNFCYFTSFFYKLFLSSKERNVIFALIGMKWNASLVKRPSRSGLRHFLARKYHCLLGRQDAFMPSLSLIFVLMFSVVQWAPQTG